jgi:hypothetical protein
LNLTLPPLPWVNVTIPNPFSGSYKRCGLWPLSRVALHI